MKRLITLLLLASIIIGCAPATQTTLPPTPQPASATATAPAAETASAQWWQDAVFYEIFVRSFYDSNNDGIGDFNGIIQKMDYLQSLGINAIWLMPIHPSPSYHGYDVTNYYAVNTEYGSMNDFKNLLAEAHKRDIKIIIDLVLNHTSSQHPFFIDANNDPQSPYRDWYVWNDKSNGANWHEGKSGYYFGLFWSGMPDLNYNNPDVTAQMENVARFWLDDIGVDGFRVDAAKHLIEENGKVENTPATHEWYKGFYKFYKANKQEAYAVGEVYNGGAFMAKTYENQLDAIFNFELASAFISSPQAGTNMPINSALRFSLKDKPDFNFATFLTNHDQNRVMSTLNGNIEQAKVASFLLLTTPGTPFIYYGEEIGMQGVKPDEDIRLPMQWNAKENAGFSTVIPWRAPFTNYSEVNVAAQDIDPDSLLNHYRNLIQIRKEHPALRTGQVSVIETGNSGVYAILCVKESETLLVLANLTDQPIKEYALTLKGAVLADGTYSVESLFGAEQVKGPAVTRGVFENYKPVDELNPFSTLIVKLLP
ncbi:MAG: DUF3459 domain-containing protein [Anaerolineales bacterium]|nr:DUF3459 domain-containing protein [Anaerolineales bacterium]